MAKGGCCAPASNGVAFLHHKLLEGVLSLKGSTTDLWIVFLLIFFENFAYFVLSVVYTLFLTDKFGISDTQAGVSYGLWGMLMSVFQLVFSPVADFVGVKKSVLVGIFLAGLGRVSIAWTQSKTVLWVALYGLLPLASGFSETMLLVGIKRNANPTGLGFAFGLYYSIKNAALLLSSSVFDVFRRNLVHGLKATALGPRSPLNDGLRLYLAITAVSTMFSFVLATFLSDGAPLDDPGAAELVEQQPRNLWGVVATTGQRFSKFAKELKDLWSATLLKFFIVCALTTNLKQILRHLDATFAKFQIRAFGCDAPVSLTYSLNPLIIIFLVPVTQAILTKFNHYNVIHFGSYITAISPFFLVASQTKWASALFVIFLSIGESVWSPRWYDYNMSIAPHGREAIFSGLASAPFFLAKLPTGWLSGWVLDKWCPKNVVCEASLPPIENPQHCNGRMMWLVIGLVTFTSPIGLLLGSKWLRETGAQRPEPTDESQNMPVDGDITDEGRPLLES